MNGARVTLNVDPAMFDVNVQVRSVALFRQGFHRGLRRDYADCPDCSGRLYITHPETGQAFECWLCSMRIAVAL